MARIAILGGSFNPPHVAHQMICLWLLATERADEVWLVPCYQHPFQKQLVPFSHRAEMCALAARSLPDGRVRVSRVEEELGGESRTLHTIEHLIAAHPEHRFQLVIGADILLEKHLWYRFDEIERLAPPIVLGRAGYPSPAGVPELPAVSSTAVRARLAAGEEVSGLVPAAVLAYLETHGLYR